MDKIEGAFREIVDSLAREKERLAILESDLSSREEQLLKDRSILNAEKQELQQREAAIKDIEDVDKQRKFNSELKQELDNKAIELRAKENELKRYENKLYEVKIMQDNKLIDLEKREELIRIKEERDKLYA